MAFVLNTLNPAEPLLADLDPLRDVLAGARVAGIGEGAHFVAEFGLARARLLRFLVEECGFTTLAFEMGAGEAAALNPWLAGEGGDAELRRFAGPLTAGLFGLLLRWLRGYNRGRSRPLRIVGIDLPNTLAPGPDLRVVAAYLRRADPAGAALLDGVLPVAERITGGSAVVSAPQWAALGTALQDGLTATLARLSLRLTILEPRADAAEHAAARRHLAAAVHTDYQLRAMVGLFTGTGAAGDPSLREHYLAATVRVHLAAAAVGDRIVVVAHNNHLQKTPVVFGGEPAVLPMGYHLARALAGEYRAVALTHTGDRVPEMALPAEDSPVGFRVDEVELPAPAPGSLEGALVDAGLGSSITLTDLRTGEVALTGIRSQSAMSETDVRQAFDAVLSSPAATRDATADF